MTLKFWFGLPRVHRPGTRRWRVAEEAPIQVAGVRTEILDVHALPFPQLTLHVEAPLILARVGEMPVRRRDVRRSTGADNAKRVGQRQRRTASAATANVNSGDERRVVREERERVHLVRVVVDPERPIAARSSRRGDRPCRLAAPSPSCSARGTGSLSRGSSSESARSAPRSASTRTLRASRPACAARSECPRFNVRFRVTCQLSLMKYPVRQPPTWPWS